MSSFVDLKKHNLNYKIRDHSLSKNTSFINLW